MVATKLIMWRIYFCFLIGAVHLRPPANTIASYEDLHCNIMIKNIIHSQGIGTKIRRNLKKDIDSNTCSSQLVLQVIMVSTIVWINVPNNIPIQIPCRREKRLWNWLIKQPKLECNLNTREQKLRCNSRTRDQVKKPTLTCKLRTWPRTTPTGIPMT